GGGKEQLARASAPEDHARPRARRGEDGVPLLGEEPRLPGQPVHVVEEYEGGDALALRGQALRDRAGEGRDVVHEPGLEPREVLRLQILGAALALVAAVPVDAPEVVLAQQ